MDEYNLSTPSPTDYFSRIFSELRSIKEMFEERYILDHEINDTDLTVNDKHIKITMYGVTKDVTADRSPYPLDPITGVGTVPDSAGIVWVNDNKQLYFSTIVSGIIKEVKIC